MITIIGQSPRETESPFSEADEARIKWLFQVDQEELERRFMLLNLFGEWPNKGWPLGDEGHPLRDYFDRSNGPVFLVGKTVASKLGLDVSAKELYWYSVNGTFATLIPEFTSPWWDQPENMRRARDFVSVMAPKDREVNGLKFDGSKLKRAIDAKIKAMPNGVRLTRKMIQDHAGVSKKRLWQFEKGEREPTFSEAQLIAEYLGCSTDSFLGER